MTEEKKEVIDLYLLKRKLQRDKRDIRKKILGIDEDHTDTSMQRVYSEATKTKRALKVELFGSKTKASATKGEETSLEAFVRKLLEEKSIDFIEQKAIRYINVDFYIPQANLAIECEGCYWHSCPTCYPQGPKNKTQKKNIEKDKRSQEIIEEQNIDLLIIWGHEIKNNPKETRERILKCISEKS